MKKILTVILTIFLVTMMTSCLSTGAVSSEPVDYPVFPSDLPEDTDTANFPTIKFGKYIVPVQIDSVSYAPKKFTPKKKYEEIGITKITPGKHRISFNYDNGTLSTFAPAQLVVILEEKNNYEVVVSDFVVEKGSTKIKFDIVNLGTGVSVFKEMTATNVTNATMNYVKYVLEEVENGDNSGVTLAGNKMIRLFAEQKVTVIDRLDYSAQEQNGYIGFMIKEMDLSKGYVYMKFNDENKTWTKDEFLKLDLDECDVVYKIKECGSDYVIFEGVKPETDTDLEYKIVNIKNFFMNLQQ